MYNITLLTLHLPCQLLRTAKTVRAVLLQPIHYLPYRPESPLCHPSVCILAVKPKKPLSPVLAPRLHKPSFLTNLVSV